MKAHRDNEGFRRRGRSAVLLVALLASIFVAGFLIPPTLEGLDLRAAEPLRTVYAPLCHQLSDRSLHVGGGPIAVCSRCCGLYVGGVAGMVLGALLIVGYRRRLRASWFLVALAPSLVDFALPWIGLPGLPNVPRFLLAIPAGLVAGMFLSEAIGDLQPGSGDRALPVHDVTRSTPEEIHG